MRFFVSKDIKKNDLLRLIVFFSAIFFFLFWLTNIFLYWEIGFSYDSVVLYYLGSEESFREPRSLRGLLEEAHFHLFSMAILLLTLTHLILFTSVKKRTKLLLIVFSFTSALGDIASSWLVRFVSPAFAHLKIISFTILQVTLLLMIVFIFFYLFREDSNNYYFK